MLTEVARLFTDWTSFCRKTGINVILAEDAISCVAIGTGKVLENIEIIEQAASGEGKSRRY